MDSNDTYCIVPISYLETLDFSTVKDDSRETVRRSVDGTKAVIFWEGDAPAGIEWPTFTLGGIRVEMQRLEWTIEEELELLTNNENNDNE
jgi:hypothetical protein